MVGPIGKGMGMSFVHRMELLPHQFPFCWIYFGKVGVCFKVCMYPGEFDGIAIGHGQGIYFPSAYYKGHGILLYNPKGFLKIKDHRAIGKTGIVIFIPCKDQVFSIGQGTGKTFKGLSPHYDIMPCG